MTFYFRASNQHHPTMKRKISVEAMSAIALLGYVFCMLLLAFLTN